MIVTNLSTEFDDDEGYLVIIKYNRKKRKYDRKLEKYWNRQLKKLKCRYKNIINYCCYWRYICLRQLHLKLEKWQLKRKDIGEILLVDDYNEKNIIVIKSVVIPLAIGKFDNNSSTLIELEVQRK